VLARFKEHIQKNFPELMNHSFLLACSGGMDSMVLTHLCSQSGLDFTLAHCNFRLRGQESDDDAAFVNEMATALDKRVYMASFDTKSYAQKQGLSIQMAARKLRYQWFKKQLEAQGIPYVVTAHHADDDLETFLINLSRGTGIKGLLGIPEKHEQIRRPLLCFSHNELYHFAGRENLSWREDSSNADTKYLRNKIRKEVVPLLKELHPTFLDNFKMTQNNLEQTYALSKAHLHEVRERLFQEKQGRIKINIAALEKLKPREAYLYGLFHEFGFTDWKSLAHLLSAVSGKSILSDSHLLLKDRSNLWLSGRTSKTTTSDYYLIADGEQVLEHPLHLRFDQVEALAEASKNIIYVDKNALKYPLELRKWKNGDYFYPFGLKGKKKLAKFFKDEKVDLLSKEDQWLLCSNDAIVWVIGRRMDDRFKITEQSKAILQITYIP
jgi:tRNA(Ile)-lysidine synthase